MVEDNGSPFHNSNRISLWPLLVARLKLLHDKPRVLNVWIPRSLGRAWKRVVRKVIRDRGFGDRQRYWMSRYGGLGWVASTCSALDLMLMYTMRWLAVLHCGFGSDGLRCGRLMARMFVRCYWYGFLEQVPGLLFY